jgi:DNA modification methylase
MTAQYVLFLVFGVILYVIVTDPNVAKAFDYVLKLVNTNIRKELWWLKNNPSNPVVKYMMYRKNLKLAKELRAKINKHLEAKE